MAKVYNHARLADGDVNTARAKSIGGKLLLTLAWFIESPSRILIAGVVGLFLYFVVGMIFLDITAPFRSSTPKVAANKPSQAQSSQPRSQQAALGRAPSDWPQSIQVNNQWQRIPISQPA